MKRLKRLLALVALIMLCVPAWVSASPFGQGEFGTDVPFGSQTSLSISLGGDVNLTLAPDGPNLSGSGSHTVTVTSTDVVGYELYAYSLGSTDMTNGSATIPASANGSPAALAINTWGFNTTNSTTDFIGMTLTPQLIKADDGPHKNGDNTTVTFGAKTDATQASGSYTTNVIYTAVAKNQ